MSFKIFCFSSFRRLPNLWKRFLLLFFVLLAQNLALAQTSWEGHTFLVTQLFGKYPSDVVSKDLPNLIAQEELTTKEVIDALEQFQSCQLHKFDPVGGDTNCQVRTHKTLELDQNSELKTQEIPRVLAQLRENLHKIAEAKAEVKLVTSLDFKDTKEKKRRLEELKNGRTTFGRYGVEPVEMSESVRYLALSYFVSKYHSELPTILERRKKLMDLKNYKDISAKTLLGMVQDARTYLVHLTNKHLGEVGERVYQRSMNSEGHDCHRSLSDNLLVDISNQHEILKEVVSFGPFKSRSTYAGIKLLLADLWHRNIPIMLKIVIFCPEHGIHKIDIMYVKGDRPFEFVPYEGDTRDLMMASTAVAEGVVDLTGRFANQSFYELSVSLDEELDKHGGFQESSTCPIVNNYIRKIKSKDLSDMVIANLAVHPQYVDKTRNIDFSVLGERAQAEMDKFNGYCDMAIKDGLCMANGSTLRVTHMFPARTAEAVGKVKVEVDREIIEQLDHEIGLAQEAKDQEEEEKRIKEEEKARAKYIRQKGKSNTNEND